MCYQELHSITPSLSVIQALELHLISANAQTESFTTASEIELSKSLDELTELLMSVVNDRNVCTEQLVSVKQVVGEQVTFLSEHLSTANVKLTEQETRIKELEKLLSNSHEDVEALRTNNPQVRISDWEATEKRSKELEEIVNSLRVDISRRVCEKVDVNTKIDHLLNEIKTKDTACEKLETKIQFLEAAIATDAFNFTEMVEKMEHLEEAVLNGLSDCVERDLTIEKQNINIIEKDRKIIKQEGIIVEKERENQIKESALSQLAMTQDEHEEERIGLVLATGQLSDEITRLNRELRQTTSKLSSKIKSLNEDITNQMLTMHELSGEICRLEVCLQQESSKCKKVESDFSVKVDDLCRTNAELNDQVRLLSTELVMQCPSELGASDSLQNDNNELVLCQRELGQCQGQLGQCQRELGQCQSILGQCQIELVQSQGEQTLNQLELKKSQSLLRQCETELAASVNEFGQFQRAQAQLEDESMHCERELSKCRGELEEERREKLSLLKDVKVLGFELVRCQGDECGSSQMSETVPSTPMLQSQSVSQQSVLGLEVATLQAEKEMLESKLERDLEKFQVLEMEAWTLRAERDELVTKLEKEEAGNSTEADRQQHRIDALLLDTANKDKITNALRLRLASEKCRCEQLLSQLNGEVGNRTFRGNEITLNNMNTELRTLVNEDESLQLVRLESRIAELLVDIAQKETELRRVKFGNVSANVCWDDSDDSSEEIVNRFDEQLESGRIFVPESPEIKASLKRNPTRTDDLRMNNRQWMTNGSQIITGLPLEAVNIC